MHNLYTQQTSSAQAPMVPVAASENNNRGARVRQPDFLLKTDGFPEIFSEIWKTDSTSKNAGQFYVSIARIVGEKRNKTWNLHRDYFGVASALLGLGTAAVQDPNITDAERARYETFRNGLAALLTQAVMPSQNVAEAKQTVDLTELAAKLN